MRRSDREPKPKPTQILAECSTCEGEGEIECMCSECGDCHDREACRQGVPPVIRSTPGPLVPVWSGAMAKNGTALYKPNGLSSDLFRRSIAADCMAKGSHRTFEPVIQNHQKRKAKAAVTQRLLVGL